MSLVKLRIRYDVKQTPYGGAVTIYCISLLLGKPHKQTGLLGSTNILFGPKKIMIRSRRRWKLNVRLGALPQSV